MSAACHVVALHNSSIALLQLYVQVTPLCHAVVLQGIREYLNVCLLLCELCPGCSDTRNIH